MSFEGARVLLVGAGGAAAAIAVSVLDEGTSELCILNRSRWRAEKLQDRLRQAYPEAGISDDDPLPVSARYLGRNTVVCDAVYRPGGETRFVRLARERGLRTVSGGRMLLYQGVRTQKIWTGREPDVRAMSGALS